MKDSEWLQNFIGKCVLFFHVKVRVGYIEHNGTAIQYYTVKRLYHSGVSLGRFIIFDDRDSVSVETVLHEHGHQIQSKQLGWKYLFKIGFVSCMRNIWDRIAHAKWDWDKRYRWYYGGFPEKQADELGGVKRW